MKTFTKPDLTFLFIFISFCSIAQPSSKVTFKNLEEGLSHSSVTALFEDSRGYLWVGTRNGLNRYNGLRFDIYEPARGVSTSLINPFINSITEDENGDLWIGTAGGLGHYLRDFDNFENFSNNSKHFNIPNNNILNVYNDGKDLWLATNSGIYVFDKDKKKTTRSMLKGTAIQYIFKDSNGTIWAAGEGIFKSTDKKTFLNVLNNSNINESDLSEIHFRRGAEDDYGGLWFGSMADGLFKLENPHSFQFLQYKPEPGNANSLAHSRVLDVKADSKGNIWIGTENGGLDKYDIKTSRFHHYQNNPDDPNTISAMSIWAILEDHVGRIWVGNFSNGLDVLDPYQKAFEAITSSIPGTINGKSVKGLAEDSKGNIWIGMDGFGVAYYDVSNNTYTHFTHDPNDPYSLSNNAVLSIAVDEYDNLLVGCWAGGLNYLDSKTGKVTRHFSESGNPNSLKIDFVYRILQDKQNKSGFWIGTWGAGLDYFDVDKQQFQHPKFDNENLIYQHVFTSKFDNQGNLWIGTENGLNKISAPNIDRINKVARFENDKNNPQSLSENYVPALHCDGKGRIWIGTSNGLNLYIPNGSKFKSFTKADGFASNSIMSILEDNDGNLWLGTTQGISKAVINVNEKGLYLTIDNYDKYDGLQGNFFKIESALKTRKGELFFGGNNGFNRFMPNDIVPNPNLPNIAFTDFKISNQSVMINDQNKSILASHVSSAQSINLDYSHKVVSIDFIALNYTRPEKNEYAYMMEGFDNDWIYNGDKKSATFTSLPAGEYTFKVKASNNDGVWNNQGPSITINVAPPWWATWWFRGFILLVVVATIYFIGKWRRQMHREQKRLLQEKLDEAMAESRARNEGLLEQNKNLQRSIEDTNHVINEAVESGNFSARINTEGKIGQWKDLSESINQLFDSVVLPLNAIDNIVNSMAAGDISQRLRENDKGDLLRLAQNFNKGLQSLNKLMWQVSEYSDIIEQSANEMNLTSTEMNRSTGEIASAISQMSSGAQTQVARVDESSQIIEGIRKAAMDMADIANQINAVAKQGTQKSDQGREMVENVSNSMQEISEYSAQTDASMQVLTERSVEISRVLNVISQIASQTNLLALNAAIEAAQAGDAGRGFAVVADEIRKLAESSKASTKAIEKLVADVQNDTSQAAKLMETMSKSVKKGVQDATEASKVFIDIADSSCKTLEFSEKIMSATKEQAENVNAVVSTIESVVVIAEQTAAGTEEVAASATELASGMDNYNLKSQKLSEIAGEQRSAVNRFKLKNNHVSIDTEQMNTYKLSS